MISATNVFSPPTQLLSFLIFTLQTSTTLKTPELSHHSSARQLPSFLFQTLIWPNKHQFFPFNLRLSPNHFSLLFLLSISHIMFLPNPNPAEQLVVFPSQSQIFRFPLTIFLFSFALSHIIFFPYSNPAEQTVVFLSQILSLRLQPNLPLFKNTSSQSLSQYSSLILSLTLS